MSTNQPARRGSGPGRAKRITIVALSMGIAATSLPLALAATASAITTRGGCHVTPLPPVYLPATLFGEAKVNYRVRIYCDAGKSVDIRQRLYEQDPHPNPDDRLGGRDWRETFFISETRVIDNVRTAPDTEQSSEEVYHTVTFLVTPFFGQPGFWTPSENSLVTSNIG